jgi:hypothetical protein
MRLRQQIWFLYNDRKEIKVRNYLSMIDKIKSIEGRYKQLRVI